MAPNNKVLVTGHLGYVGSVLTKHMLSKGYAVTGCDTNLFTSSLFYPGGETADVHNLSKDIRNLLPEDLEGFDSIVHLAALSNDPLGELKPGITNEINMAGSVHVAQVAKSAGVRRFVFASSCSNYGKAGKELVNENSDLNPQTEYGRSKVDAESALAELVCKDFCPVYLRFATAYGVSPKMRFDIVLNNLVAYAYTTGKVRLLSDGSPWRPLIHVEDMARAFCAALEAPEETVRGQAFNVCRESNNYQIKDIAQIVAEVVPGSTLEISENAAPDTRSYRVSSAKIERLLPEFEPIWDAKRGAEQLFEAVKSYKLTQDAFEGQKFTRLKQLEYLMENGRINERFEPSSVTEDPRLRSAPPRKRTPDVFAQDALMAVDRISGERGLMPVLDLGPMPNANSLVSIEERWKRESLWPLEMAFSPISSLCQIVTRLPKEFLFKDDYPYYSSVSNELLEHSRKHAAKLLEELALDQSSLVIELASNDGYLLKNFVEANVPVLGIDPAPQQASKAIEIGVETICDFFGQDLAANLASKGILADVVLANNVVGHVSDQNDFVAGISKILKPGGRAVVEFPYVRHLIERLEFDTIYHEHFCYFSCTSAKKLFEQHGLELIDVSEVPIHGGSIRLTFSPNEKPGTNVEHYLAEEKELGLTEYRYYSEFGERVVDLASRVRALFTELKSEELRVAAYGAAAKGAVALNFFGLDFSVIDFVADLSPHKQNKFMPGTQIPIVSPERLVEAMPDVVVILAWNFAEEIIAEQQEYLEKGGRFLTLIPDIKFHSRDSI